MFPTNLAGLSKTQLGKAGEYWAKLQLTLYGLDVYTSEVDEKGIDFVVRTNDGRYAAVQVKSLRKPGYVYLKEKHFAPGPGLLVALNLFYGEDGPRTLLIPSRVWLEPIGAFVVNRFKAGSEYGINVSKRAMPQLSAFGIEKMATYLEDGDFT